MGLGINKDLEPLVRQVRRAGGEVEVTRSNHVRWQMPGGSVLRTGLTMNSRSARNVERQIRAALCATVQTSPPTQAPTPWRCTPDGRGKFNLVGEDGQPMLNAGGYPRTFSSEDDAYAAAAASST